MSKARALLFLIVVMTVCSFSFSQGSTAIPVYFKEYGLIISEIKLFDTVYHKTSGKEMFKIIFINTKGRCYLERYINNRIVEKGQFESTHDTLTMYVSGLNSRGIESPPKAKLFFQPVRNGIWMF